tara:strand:- start:652 stop:909 length:258 start_codon:yes stop_codon:yes gene_type:complete
MEREVIMIAVGLAIAAIGWFIKREIVRVETKIIDLKEKMREMELAQLANDTRDRERWRWIDKNMEDRRQDIRKLYDISNVLSQRD